MEIPKFCIEDFVLDGDFEKQGGQAKVYKGFHSSHGNVAIKQWFSDPDNMRNEMELLKQNAYHQNIVQFLGILINDKSKCIGYVMPYMPMGSLHDVIHDKSQQYDQKEIKSWITQICYGLSYLHGKQIIHRDIKPSNVLLGRCYDDVKLSDFGTARSLNNITSTLTGGLGTLLYMAPEILRGDRYDVSVDVYSLSITIWEILYRRCPYDCATGVFEFMNRVTQGERPQLGSNLSKEESDLLMSCWNADTSKRPTVDYVCEFCSVTTFSLIDFENSVNEGVPPFANLDVHNNTEGFSETIAGKKLKDLKKCFQPLTFNQKMQRMRQLLFPQEATLFYYTKPFSALNDGEQQPISKKLPFLEEIQKSLEKQTVLVLGGIDDRNRMNSLLMLENNGQNWKELNIKLPYPMFAGGAQFVNNSLYIFGGIGPEGSSNCTYKLSKSLKWEKMADMNQKRYHISNSNVILNNQIWVCGGWDDTVEMYDPLTNKWKYMKQMNEGRLYAAAAVINGKIFCCGGLGERDALKSVECYDPSSDIWRPVCYMPQSLCGHGAVEMNGNLIIMGGYDFHSKESLDNVWSLDTMDKNAEWIEKPSMSILRENFSIAKIGDRLFACGGNGAKDSVKISDGEIWRNGPKMPTPRSCTAAVVVPTEFGRDLEKFIPESSGCSVQ